MFCMETSLVVVDRDFLVGLNVASSDVRRRFVVVASVRLLSMGKVGFHTQVMHSSNRDGHIVVRGNPAVVLDPRLKLFR